MERQEGAAAVVRWFESLERSEPPTDKYQYLLGSHDMDHGRPHDAIPRFTRAIEFVLHKHGVAFDDALELSPMERVEQLIQNELADLWPDVTYLSKCYERIGELDTAYAWATRGVSLHRHINQRKGYCSLAQIEAGDTACRILRARVHIARAEWDAAEREITHAATFEDGWSKNRVSEAREHLKRSQAR